jgi:hypothetical protein
VEPNTPTKIKVLFFSFVGENYSRSSTILHGETEDFDKKFIKLPIGIVNSTRVIINMKKELKSADYLVVMSRCHILTPILKLLSNKRVILDAGWSLTDGQLSRGQTLRKGIRLLQSYLIDLLAFHTADIVIVESEIQRYRTSRMFFLPRIKIGVNFTGLDESAYSGTNQHSEKISKLDESLQLLGFNTKVLFRGKVNNESGIQNILDAASLLEKKVSFILVCGKSDQFSGLPSNVILLTELTNDELRAVYQRADITLGQISKHSRLNYTIPHKAFEAGFFSKVYITSNMPAIRELYRPNSISLIDDISGIALAAEIERFSNPIHRTELENRISDDYKKRASQENLSKNFEKIIQGL